MAGPIVVVGIIAAMCAVALSVIRNGNARATQPTPQPGWLLLPSGFTAGPHTWRDATRLKRLSKQLAYPYSGTIFLEPHTVAYALSLVPTMGRTINGEIAVSSDLRRILAAGASLGSESQEWIAREGGLALVDPRVNGSLAFKWTDIASVHIVGPVSATDAALDIAVRLSTGDSASLRLQAILPGASNLFEIASAAGVATG